MQHRRSITAGLVLLAGVLCAAAPAAAGRGWPMRRDGDLLLVQTPHYVLHTDHEPAVAQLIASHQEALFRELYRRLGTISPNKMSGRWTVKVFRKQQRYQEALGPTAKGSRGLYVHAKKILAAWGSPDHLEVVFETLRHEGTHQFVVHFIGPGVPVWLNEGMAVFYQHSRFEEGRLVLGEIPPQRLVRLKKAIKGGEIIHLDRMLQMSDQRWLDAVHAGGSHAGLQYDQAWAMVHFLAFAREKRYRGRLNRFIHYLSRGSQPLPAWKKTFGTDFEGFERGWKEYVLGLDAPENLSCRQRLRLLAHLVVHVYKKRPEAVKDLASFRKALMEGSLGKWSLETDSGLKLSHDDREGIARLFRCPADKRERVKISYELAPAKDGRPPVLRCTHHAGYVLQSRYEKKANGSDFTINVVTKPRPATRR